MSLLILNTPCFPKNSYHIGNALSQIMTDIMYRYLKLYKQRGVKYVCHSWNLHGKTPELLCNEKCKKKSSYKEILQFTTSLILKAKEEKSFFTEYPSTQNTNDFITYTDTDSEFMDFCTTTFLKLVRDGWVKNDKNHFYLDINTFFKKFSFAQLKDYIDKINILPEYHSRSILDISKTINGDFPLSKDRVFTVVVKECHNAPLNPIFQSFLMPLYISNKYKTSYPAYFQVSSSGNKMLEWHYLRTILSIILTNTVPYKNLWIHGSILDKELKPMSKYSPNLIQPSNLYHQYRDKSFIRYLLIKSISFHNIQPPVELARSEYLKIVRKLNLLNNKNISITNSSCISNYILKSLEYLEKFLIKQALEQYYLGLSKAELVISSDPKKDPTIATLLSLKQIFFDSRI